MIFYAPNFFEVLYYSIVDFKIGFSFTECIVEKLPHCKSFVDHSIFASLREIHSFERYAIIIEANDS